MLNALGRHLLIVWFDVTPGTDAAHDRNNETDLRLVAEHQPGGIDAELAGVGAALIGGKAAATGFVRLVGINVPSIKLSGQPRAPVTGCHAGLFQPFSPFLLLSVSEHGPRHSLTGGYKYGPPID